MGRGQDILARVQSWEERLCCLCLCSCLFMLAFESLGVCVVFMIILRLICELLPTSINVGIDNCEDLLYIGHSGYGTLGHIT